MIQRVKRYWISRMALNRIQGNQQDIAASFLPMFMHNKCSPSRLRNPNKVNLWEPRHGCPNWEIRSTFTWTPDSSSSPEWLSAGSLITRISQVSIFNSVTCCSSLGIPSKATTQTISEPKLNFAALSTEVGKVELVAVET